MNILGLISQLIGIKTLRLTKPPFKKKKLKRERGVVSNSSDPKI